MLNNTNILYVFNPILLIQILLFVLLKCAEVSTVQTCITFLQPGAYSFHFWAFTFAKIVTF